MQKPIYFDYNATTPTDPQVLQAMIPYFTDTFGNSANLHFYGTHAQKAIDESTRTVAQFINADPCEITWNSGATEGNNTTVFGFIKKMQFTSTQKSIHIITSLIEHSSVLNAFKECEKIPGVTVSYLEPDLNGFVGLDEIKRHLTAHTKLISLIWVNNEIGTINPVPEIAKFCHEKQIAFHTDATQAIGKIKIDLKDLPIDYLTFSSHKFYGPKGVGILYQRTGQELPPLLFGGGHQNNLRSGTLNTPNLVGTACAIKLIEQSMSEENLRLQNFAKKIYSELKSKLPNVKLNGAQIGPHRSPINLSLTFQTPIEWKQTELANLAFSQGAACKSGKTASSHVLSAIGLTEEESSCTIRLSLGRWTTENDVNSVILTLSQAFKPLETVVT